eukprot:1158109-Pelagomonas_calceolata.AAC.6
MALAVGMKFPCKDQCAWLSCHSYGMQKGTPMMREESKYKTKPLHILFTKDRKENYACSENTPHINLEVDWDQEGSSTPYRGGEDTRCFGPTYPLFPDPHAFPRAHLALAMMLSCCSSLHIYLCWTCLRVFCAAWSNVALHPYCHAESVLQTIQHLKRMISLLTDRWCTKKWGEGRRARYTRLELHADRHGCKAQERKRAGPGGTS